VEYLDRFIKETMEAGPDAMDKIWWTFKFTARFGLEHSDLVHCLRNLSLELAPSEDKNVKAFFEILDKQRKFFVSLIKDAQSEGYIRTDFDAELLAAIILAVNDGIFLQWSVFRKILNGRDLAWAYRQVLLSGMFTDAEIVFPKEKMSVPQEKEKNKKRI
jgi:hypothetical protein